MTALALALLLGGAPEPVQVSPSVGRVALGPHAHILEDPTGTLDLAGARAVAFAPLGAEVLNVGYSRSAYWLTFVLENVAAVPTLWRLSSPAGVDDALLYTNAPDGEVEMQHSGERLPYLDRAVPGRHTTFTLRLGPHERRAYWLRLSSADTYWIEPVLFSPTAFAEQSARDDLGLGLYYGLMLAMVLYNAFIFIATRERAYLYYVVFQLAIATMLASVDQLTLEYLWPASPEWSAKAEVVFAGAAIGGALAFARSFLGDAALGSRTVGQARWLSVAAVLVVFAGLVSSAQWVQESSSFVVIAGGVLLLWMGVRAWWGGGDNAPFFVAGWAILVVANTVNIVTALGLVPSLRNAGVAVKLGSAAEAMLLAWGLAHRIKRLREEKDRARDALLAERARQAEELSRRVDERTRELAGALATLKATQARLVQQARLASLGHLVAGVAHEVGNPLNFAAGGANELERHRQALSEAIEGLAASPAAASGPLLSQARETLARWARAHRLVREGLRRIGQIVDSLRGFLGPQAGRTESRDLVAEVETTLDMMQSVLEQRHVRVHRDFRARPTFPCRGGELAQVFTNLLVNSCAAMPDGGDIKVWSDVAGGVVELGFADTGTGIPPEHRQAIFDPFFTSKADGTGLGLSISHEIVQRHGGELFLADSDRGARFVIRLPLPRVGS